MTHPNPINPSPPPDPLTHERDFIARLSRLERGPLAELRRSLSDTPGNREQWLDSAQRRTAQRGSFPRVGGDVPSVAGFSVTV